jgi:hypothetical protein
MDMPTNSPRVIGRSSPYQKLIGVLIWLAFAAAGVGILYGLGFLAGD